MHAIIPGLPGSALETAKRQQGPPGACSNPNLEAATAILLLRVELKICGHFIKEWFGAKSNGHFEVAIDPSSNKRR
jgi:hypothetical protein